MNTLTKFVLSDVIIVATCFLLAPYFYNWSPLNQTVHKAIAVIHPTQGNTATGKVTFTQEKNGVRVVAECSGLTPGKHAIHIHEFGDCGCVDAACAGAHFNPTNQPHGGPHTPHHHVGDFGNLDANEEGHATLEFVSNDITLNGRHSIIGRSVIIHAKEDDFVTQPSGNAGDRIGCGNIGIAGK
jgi:Cu-Zn family superoxide dismutase